MQRSSARSRTECRTKDGPLFRIPAGENSQVSVVPYVVPGDVVLLCGQRHGLHALFQTQHAAKQEGKIKIGHWKNKCFKYFSSHVSFQEQIQEHPLGPDLGKVQRMVESVSECNELWDFLKGSVLVSLDDIL